MLYILEINKKITIKKFWEEDDVLKFYDSIIKEHFSKDEFYSFEDVLEKASARVFDDFEELAEFVSDYKQQNAEELRAEFRKFAKWTYVLNYEYSDNIKHEQAILDSNKEDFEDHSDKLDRRFESEYDASLAAHEHQKSIMERLDISTRNISYDVEMLED